MNNSTVDLLDLKLISLLKENSRLSFSYLANKINLSPSATRERVQRLEDRGVIKQYKLELDYKLMGYDVEAFILIKVFHGQLKSFLKVINNFPEVLEAHRITGNLNVHLKILVKDQLHLQKLIDNLMYYGDINTFLILSQITK